jgi:hypothetical protein
LKKIIITILIINFKLAFSEEVEIYEIKCPTGYDLERHGTDKFSCHKDAADTLHRRLTCKGNNWKLIKPNNKFTCEKTYGRNNSKSRTDEKKLQCDKKRLKRSHNDGWKIDQSKTLEQANDACIKVDSGSYQKPIANKVN